MGVSVGVDVGGTFTDFVVCDGVDGSVREMKVPSTPGAPAGAVAEGFSRLLAEGIEPGEITRFAHGTTVALNTLLQRGGARVGLLVTRGFRDVLVLRRLRLADAPGFHVRQAPPLVARRDVREVDGRLLADGTEVRPLALDEAVAAAADLVADGCEVLAVCLLHAYRDPAHEQRVGEAIRHRFPELHVSLSSEIWPQQREYERTQVTVINAHVAPIMERYFSDLEKELRQMGVGTGILSTKSSGGVMSAARAARRPVETLLSGPASGVVAAVEFGRAAGLDALVAFDMGGTSADIGLVDAGGARISTEATVGDFPVLLPAVDVSSVGAGGGSVATLDAAGVLKVGPRSAGAVPGPACYGRGGTEPTVTDAYATLGVLTHLLGGQVPLDLDAAHRACGELGERLGTDAVGAAEAILEVATANMYARILPILAQRGVDPRELALLAYGGAGPTHAFRVAREVGFGTVVVPPSPGTFCALGCLLADLRADFVATLYTDLARLRDEELADALRELHRQASAWAREEDAPGASVTFGADMRYRGQSYELAVPLSSDLGEGACRRAAEAFADTHQRVYGYADPDAAIEVVNVRAQLLAPIAKPSLLHPGAGSARPDASHAERRTVYAGGSAVTALVVDRSSLVPGGQLEGPVVVTQYDTTTFVPPGAVVETDAVGNLIGRFDD
jgi:N-methylhydantoinase A